MNYSKRVEHWLPPQSVPPAILPVVDALEKKGVNVCRVGIENPKAPIHYVFVDQAFDAKAVLAGLYESGGLAADSDGSGIHSREYAWVGFEEGICPPL